MQAVIFAAGEGVRLRPITHFIPKPMVPIAGKPILERIVNHLSSYKIKDIIIITGYLGNYIKDYFGDGLKFGVNINYSHFDDWKQLGFRTFIDTKNLLKDEFIQYSGDIICNMDLKALLKFHSKNNGIATLPLLKSTTLPKYAYVELNKDMSINKFHITSPEDILTTSEIFLMKKEIFNFIVDPEERTEETLAHAMIDGKKVYGLVMDCYWYHIQNWTDLEIIKRDVAEGKLKLEF